MRRLTGGVETSTHEVTLDRAADDRLLRLVLRRPHQWAIEQNPDAVAQQAAVLAHVAHNAPDLPAPEVLAHDATGLLMQRLPGRIDVVPRDMGSWLQQQADALRVIHGIPPIPAAPRAVAAVDISAKKPPEWSVHPELWEQALATIAAGHPDPDRADRELTFVHGDFQHFNLLWSRGRLTGIVDWSSYKARHPSKDVGHCRLNLVILYGSEVADDLARRYGAPVDPWWDLFETCIFLPSWGDTIVRQVGTRLGVPVDVDAIHRRVDAHLPNLLDRVEVSRPSLDRPRS